MVGPSPSQAEGTIFEQPLPDDELVERLRRAAGFEKEGALRVSLQEQTAGQYEILETLGGGGGGVVFKARDLKLDRLVAIKCLAALDQPDRLAAALREARVLATINHSNVCALYAVCESQALPFIVMEYVDGVAITEAAAGLPVSRQLELFCDLLRAAGELHRRNLVHRDLTPANVLVDRNGRVKIVDFGIARPADSGPTHFIEGTPAYLAPEQSLGQPARQTADVFSLGVILFEVLTGRRPFQAASPAKLLSLIASADPPLPRSLREEIPGAVQAICLTALEKDASLRYTSAGEFLRDLDRFASGEAVWANPTVLASALDHGIDRHEADIHHWQKDRLITPRECDSFLDAYGRLREREAFWILDSRRISFSQVMLHLGCWSCAVAAFLMLAFPWEHIGIARPILPAALLAVLLAGGGLLWRRRNRRIAVVLLMGGAITLPLAVGTILGYFNWLGSDNTENDVLRDLMSNRQMLVCAGAWFVISLYLWRRTGTAAFAILSGLSALAVATAAFGWAGLVQQLRDGHIETVAGWYIVPGISFIVVALLWDVLLHRPAFAVPFYIMGLVVLIVSFTLIACFGPTLQWLHWLPQADDANRGDQIKYSFIINGGIYLIAGLLADRLGGSALLRRISAFLFWIAPSHLLVPLLRLESHWPIGGSSWTVAELVLPAGALIFIFSSVPKQMKPFFFSGMLYAAISVQRMTARHFEDEFAWPVTLALLGLTMACIAWRWPGLLDRTAGQRRSRSDQRAAR